MDPPSVESELRSRICESIRVIPDPEDSNRFVIASPFTFDDGDMISIVLKRADNTWYFTDEGNTFMHLSYEDTDFDKGTIKEHIDTVLRTHYIKNDEGELKLGITNESYGESFFVFLQGLTKIADAAILRRDRAKSSFLEIQQTINAEM